MMQHHALALLRARVLLGAAAGIVAIAASSASASSSAAVSVGQPLPASFAWQEYDPGSPAVLTALGPAGLITPSPSVSSATSASPATSGLKRYTVSTTDWATLRNYPGHYVVALAANGWGDDVATTYNSNGYALGYVAGSSTSIVEACAWLGAQELGTAYTPPTFDCGPYASNNGIPDNSIVPSAFMSFYNGNVFGVNCSMVTHKCDGQPATLQTNATNCNVASVPVYSNVSPWAPNIYRDGRVLWTIPNGSMVLWRYVTTDGRFALIRDPTSGRGGLNDDWGFIPTGCIPWYSPRYAPPSY